MKWKRMICRERDLGDFYLVSEEGHIQNLRTGKILAQSEYGDTYGGQKYKNVTIHIPSLNIKDEKNKVHLIVAETFLEQKPFQNAQVNYKDGNKHNNHISNLEWTSPKENMEHAQKNNLMDESAEWKPVYCVEEKKAFRSISDAGRYVRPDNPKLGKDNISKALNRNNGRGKSANLTWVLIDKEHQEDYEYETV